MKRREIVDGKTTCSKCKSLKSVEEFGANKSRWDGLHPTCKECRKISRKETYQRLISNPEKLAEVKASSLKYAHENRHKVRVWAQKSWLKYREDRLSVSRAYSKENREKINEVTRTRRASNPEKYRKIAKEMRCLHRERFRAEWRLKNARRRGAEGKCSVTEWEEIIERQNRQCNACRRDDLPLTLDHIIPITRGGTNWPDNIQGLCLSCNIRKYNSTMDEFRAGGFRSLRTQMKGRS